MAVQLDNLDRVAVLQALRKNIGLEDWSVHKCVSSLWYGCDKHSHPHEGPCMKITCLGGVELGRDVMDPAPYDELAKGKKSAAEVVEELRRDPSNFYRGRFQSAETCVEPAIIREIVNANRCADNPLKEKDAGDPLLLTAL